MTGTSNAPDLKWKTLVKKRKSATQGVPPPLEVMLYEEWDDTKEQWLVNEATKPYRTAYRADTAHLIAESGDLEWLSPIRIYECGRGRVPR